MINAKTVGLRIYAWADVQMENLLETGSINKASQKNCILTKLMYEKLIEVYVRLTEEQKNKLFSKC